MEPRAVVVREIEVLVDADREAILDVVGSLGTVRALTDEEDALTLRLEPGVSYRDAVRRLRECRNVRGIYCHHPIVANWKASRPLSADTKSDLDAAAQDFAGVPASDRVAKGTPPAARRSTGGRMPANLVEEQFVISNVPGRQHFVPPPLGYSYWHEVGPRGYAAFGTRCSGRVDAIAFHPTNAEIFYVGSNSGGLWRTTDGGSSYTPLSDRWDSLTIFSIAVDGSHQPETVFVGKGGSDPTLLRSDDGGASFQPVHPAVFAHREVRDIYVVPDAPSTVLAAVAATDGYIYRSVDGGGQFTPVLTDTQGNSLQGRWRQIEGGIKMGPTRYVYALGTAAGQATMAWSTDGGATWTRTTCPATDSNAEIAASQTALTTVYYYSPSSRTVWKSAFAGAAWGAIYLPGAPPWDAEDTPMFDQAASNTMIGVARRTIDSVPSDAVYVGGVGLMRTTNNGSSWQALDAGHGDYCCFALAPGGGAFLIGTHGGVFHGVDLADSPVGPAVNLLLFSPRNHGLGITQFYTGAFSATSSLGIVGGTQDNGTVSRLDSDDWRMGSNNDGGAVALSRANDDIQFGSDQNYHVYRTDSRWETHEDVTTPYGKLVGLKWDADKVPWLGSGTFELDPNTAGELYAGTNYLYRYNLATGVWAKRVAGVKFGGDGLIETIRVALGDSGRVYVGGAGGLWMSQDHGATWTRIDIPAVSHPTSLPGSTRLVSLHPANKNDVVAIVRPPSSDPYATPPSKVYRCANTTAYPRVWTELSTVAAPTGLARDFDDPGGTFYMSTGGGVLKSIDGGQTWTSYDYELGLPVISCKAIMAVTATRSLWVATYGRGFWKMQIPTVILDVAMPARIEAGRQAMATVSIGRQAQPGGENVWLTTNVPGAAMRRLTVPGGATSVAFSVETTGLPAGQRQIEVKLAVGSSSLARTIDVAP
jgi:hypothetical protein